MKALILSVTVIFVTAFTSANAQSKEAEKYRTESEEMRKQVWAWDKPEFKVREIPKEYANASKVIIARHTELTASYKAKFSMMWGIKKNESLTEVAREMIKVKDKNAVTDYSELSFTQFQRSSGFIYDSKTTVYVGARVIKPNGSIKEINADDIVLTKDEAWEKKAKLAVPDLQPGDIIDYFIATVKLMDNDFSDNPYNVILFDDAPMLSLSFHAQLDKKFSIVYRSYNDAPEMLVSKNDDKDIIADINKNNIAPFETSLWISPGLQLPFIRMKISLGGRGLEKSRMGINKPGEINKLTDEDDAVNDRTSYLSSIYYDNYWLNKARHQFNEIVDETEKKAKQMGTRYKDLNNEDKAALLFYTFRYTKLLAFNIETLSRSINIGNYSFGQNALFLYCILKYADFDASMILSSYRSGVKIKEAMDREDISTVAYQKDEKKFFSLESVYDIPFIVPAEIEGLIDTKELRFSNGPTSVRKEFSIGPTIPTSTADKNAHIENLKLSLTADKINLAIHRSTTLKGHYKADEQKNLILYEDFYEEERKAFNDEESLVQGLEDGKKSRKYVDEVKNAFAEARKKQKDAFLKEAKDWLEQEITDLKDYKTDTLGVRHTAPNFVYSSSFNLGGLVKKAGNNIIVEIGKIQGQPLVVKQEQRKRDIDVYMPYARSIEYNIELEIPDGYSAEGIAALNKKVENETGFFIAEATSTDKIVSIKLKKHYLHNFEPAKNWDKLNAFMDASNEWVNAKLLLKKK